jgi:GH15 family glucan-1,4-alpha-glucosidase
MASRIEDYALLGDCQTAALVGRDGSIDWLCFPQFDSGACFARLLGTVDNGRWLLAPAGPVRRLRRRYWEGTLILETEVETDEGEASIIDFMPIRGKTPDVVRIVVGRRGTVAMRMELVIRFDYGSIIPWVRRRGEGIKAIAGPEALRFDAGVPIVNTNFTTRADFTVSPGQRVPFVLTWYPSHLPSPPIVDAEVALAETKAFWEKWSSACTYRGEYREAVLRSAITLKALTYAPTGAIVAAPTTSLPERFGGVRNWDYRFCWLRDATFTLYSLMTAGYTEEARGFERWLLRAVAGTPSQLQIMYGLGGERRLTELEVDWLTGYEGSHPVRLGNAAHAQRQLDVYGEIMDAMYVSARLGLPIEETSWAVLRSMVTFLESIWAEPDEGIWEVRGGRRQFTHSKVMAWVAFDRAIKAVEMFGREGPAARWKEVRRAIHEEVCKRGFDPEIGSFVQFYGAKCVDASLLMIPMVGFLPPEDPRVQGTVRAVQRDLMRDGFVDRYPTVTGVDGLPAGEGAFLACTFWLADNLKLLGQTDEARAIFERLLGLRNDVGLLSEQYDVESGRLAGNFPQAFSHVSLINTAINLSQHVGPAEHRKEGCEGGR